MNLSNKKRPLQLASVIQRALVDILYKMGIKNVTISEVRLSPDLKYADTFFSCLQPNYITADELQDMSSEIKFKLGKVARLRFIPELRFKLDTTFDTFSKIDMLLS